MPPKETTVITPKKRSIKKIVIRTLVIAAFVLITAAAVYFYLQTVKLKKTPADVAAAQVKDTVAKVSRLILLPQGETPTLASVSDPSLLKSQTFFDKSQKGDQVLIYSNAKEAILYRPSTNMVINVAPVNIGASANQNTNAPTPIEPSAPVNAPTKK
jgi:hypothetical protein